MEDKKQAVTKTRYQFLTGNMLKWIAAASMTVDHAAAVVLKGYVRTNAALLSNEEMDRWVTIYGGMRSVGRTAFPLFAFLLVEGLLHTKDRRKYGERLFLFALLSEIPYDLAISGKLWNPARQNVLVTLFLGFLVLCFAEFIRSREKLPEWGAFAACAAGIAAGGALAWLSRSDYTYKGIFLICVFYFLRRYPVSAAIGGFCIWAERPMSFPAFLLLPFYNGKRGRRNMRLFYLFYPLHLCILYGINVVFGWRL